MAEEMTFAGTAEERQEKASGPILAALTRAEKEFDSWQSSCDTIDAIYSKGFLEGAAIDALADGSWNDAKLDLFWASFEVLKPAVYARPPVPAVKPMFSDGRKVLNLTAEVLERATTNAFAKTDINQVMLGVRDDVLFAGRGVPWLRYETDDGQKVCVDHLDRRDFLHEPARKWSEVGWAAGRFWLTRDEIKKRFKLTEDELDAVEFTKRRDRDETHEVAEKAGVWEVWHKADNKVYWVTKGVDKLLDSAEPETKLSGFFPCPRPAYGTLKRRSLIPVPDWERYAVHFRKISDLTAKIYLLLSQVKMMGLVGGGGDIADAITDMLQREDDQIIVRVNSIANVAESVVWMPLTDLATAIQGLIEARTQLIEDFYQLSGISDIMRGATEAEETLGAQQLKSQYGSVRVRDRIDELQRVAADAVKIAAEIIAQHFTQKNILDMAQMEIPTRKDIEKRVKEIEKGAEEELKALGEKAQKAAQGAAQQQQSPDEQPDPQQAQQALQQAQQAIFAKYAPMLQEVEQQTPIEDVITLLRDDRARSFAFDVESDSTILTDELQEKASRNEFMQEFVQASQGLMALTGMGEPGAKLAGEMLKFVLAPYRAGRQLDSAIDAFIEAAPEMAAKAAGQQGDGEALAEAQHKLAEAEMVKAKAAMAGVEAKAALDKAEMQRKFLEMQQKGQIEADKHQREAEKLGQQLRDMAGRETLIQAQVDNLTAETAKILASIGLDARKQELSEYQAANEAQRSEVEQARAMDNDAADTQFRERAETRADRAQEASEQVTE